MVISIPTGAKIFNWLFTMYRGHIRFELPMMWVVAFMLTFAVGGMTGVLLAVPPADFVLHNSLFLVAHFHNVIIGGVVFGLFAGMVYWFPKAFGFRLDPFWGKVAFWGWVIGYWLAWTPMYIVGLMGVTRRLRHVDDPTMALYFVDRRDRRRDHPDRHPGLRDEHRHGHREARRSCATRPAIPGTAARSNGRPPRRRRPTISRSRRSCTTSTPGTT